MDRNEAAYRGCFLGLGVGDAMGYTVDELSWQEICAEYGPDGLLGYDLRNGTAEITSYTQIAAYVANGLLLGVTRGRSGALRYITYALREWYKRQHFPRDPEKSLCWVSQIPELRRRHCRDARMLDALRLEPLGTLEKPINGANSPGAILVGAVIGLYFDPRRMEPQRIGELTAGTVALTHGDPEAFLSAAVLAYAVAGIVQEPQLPLQAQFTQAAEAVDMQFRERFPQASQVASELKLAIAMAETDCPSAQEGMERLQCVSASQCLAGAMYACLVSEDFDAAMIASVNHSGRSGAVGAITGAILGAYLTETALPEFYLESLTAADSLRTLAADLALGSPTSGLFDDTWDQKYTQGIPL